jgi:hypothetical protein
MNRRQALALLAGAAVAPLASGKDKPVDWHDGEVWLMSGTNYNSWTDRTKCYEGLDNNIHCTGDSGFDFVAFPVLDLKDGHPYFKLSHCIGRPDPIKHMHLTNKPVKVKYHLQRRMHVWTILIDTGDGKPGWYYDGSGLVL